MACFLVVYCVSQWIDPANVENAGSALVVKHCLQMPMYPATLHHIPPPIQESVILTFGRQLKTSLQKVYQKGYGHNDVKAANIFISATGERQPITQFHVCMLSSCNDRFTMTPSLLYYTVAARLARYDPPYHHRRYFNVSALWNKLLLALCTCLHSHTSLCSLHFFLESQKKRKDYTFRRQSNEEAFRRQSNGEAKYHTMRPCLFHT